MTQLIKGTQGFSFIWSIQGCAAGQGKVFDLSILNRVYNLVKVCLKGITFMSGLISYLLFRQSPRFSFLLLTKIFN